VTDPRDIPKLQMRPCAHCEHRHYFLTDEGDAENCPSCGNDLYPIVTLVGDPPTALMEYVQHKPRCDALQPMWHKGPCSCGLSTLLKFVLKDMPAAMREKLGPGAVMCTTCGDKGILDSDTPCPNCKD
jgi:hypothetical protein